MTDATCAGHKMGAWDDSPIDTRQKQLRCADFKEILSTTGATKHSRDQETML